MGGIYTLRHYVRAFLLQPRQSAAPTALPPGVVPNYVNPPTISNQVIVTSLTLIVISSLFVITRLLIKWRVVKKWGWDDCEQYSKLDQPELTISFSIDSVRFCECQHPYLLSEKVAARVIRYPEVLNIKASRSATL